MLVPEEVDLRSPAHAVDPYPTYSALRRFGRPYWDERSSSWYVAGFEDVHRLLASNLLEARGIPPWVDELPENERTVIAPVEEFYSRWLVFSDRPDHGLLRSRLYSTLAGSAMRALRERVGAWTASVVEQFDPESDDLIANLAAPLALRCLEEVLGVEGDDTAALVALSDRLIDYLTTSGSDLDAAPGATRAIADLEEVVYGLLLPKRRGLVTSPLAELADDGAVEPLTICAAVAQFLTGTVEPTTTSVAVALDQCSKSDSARADLRNGSLTAELVTEEALRYDSPFHFAPRRARLSFELEGENIAANQRVVLLLASANRDESRWRQADVFDPARPPQPHLAFGRGPHSCLGAALARLQTSEAVRAAAQAGLLEDLGASLERVPRIGATVLRRVPLT